jgi:8-oxo-dGTP pyrophosphatase MutT (NUDIX family)
MRLELGVQESTLDDTQLFVLPSTSPANAAVPWQERLRWFHELAGRSSGLPIRQAVRAVVVAPDGRTLMLHYENEYEDWWIPPGGGVDPGESDEQALRRELREELGCEDFEIGPLLFESERWFLLDGYGGQRNRVYLVRTPYFDVRVVSEARDARWFTLEELGLEPGRPWEYESLVSSASDW